MPFPSRTASRPSEPVSTPTAPICHRLVLRNVDNPVVVTGGPGRAIEVVSHPREATTVAHDPQSNVTTITGLSASTEERGELVISVPEGTLLEVHRCRHVQSTGVDGPVMADLDGSDRLVLSGFTHAQVRTGGGAIAKLQGGSQELEIVAQGPSCVTVDGMFLEAQIEGNGAAQVQVQGHCDHAEVTARGSAVIQIEQAATQHTRTFGLAEIYVNQQRATNRSSAINLV